MRTVTVIRKFGSYGMFRKLHLKIDGVRVGGVRARKSVVLDIPDDAVELCGAMDWATTDPIMLEDVKDGDTIVFAPYFTMDYAKNVDAKSMPIKVTLEQGR